MAAILIIAHAPLASSLRAVAQHVYPDCSQRLAALDVDAGASVEQVESQARAALGALGHPDALILADVYGATPCNAAMKLADAGHVRVVAGVNVPMLWRALCYATEPIDELAARAVAGATQGVVQAVLPRPQEQAKSVVSDDQVEHHRQQ
jgi:mannose PTS system EIIA component